MLSSHVRIPGVVDLEPIGRGGFGVVYRGRQPDMGRDVAVKVISATTRPSSAKERWRREVQAMGRLSNHPNIVAVYSGGITTDGSPYLVMPYVPGGSLGERITEQGPMDPIETAGVGAKLAGALATAHAAGILHRDVKPDNVLLSPYGEPQITDFGIARLLDSTTTATGTVHATLTYAPPEVLAGQPATEAADVYGLGATLYACLTGTPPFPNREDESLVALVGRIASQPPPDLRAAGVPQALASVIEHSLAKIPDNRIRTADELRQRLEDAAEAMAGIGSDATTEMARPAAPPQGGGVADAHTVQIPVMPQAFVPEPQTIPASDQPRPRATVRPAEVPVDQPEPVEKRRHLGLVAAGSLLLLALAALVFVVATRGDDGGGQTAAPSTAAEVSPTTTSEAPPATTELPATTDGGQTATTTPATTTPTTTSPATTAPATTTPTQTTTASAASSGPIGEVAGTYAGLLASGDIEGAYAITSPGFRAAQPFDRFEAFWTDYEVTVVGDPDVNESAQTAGVTFELDGDPERIELVLVPADGGGFLIDGPRPRR